MSFAEPRIPLAPGIRIMIPEINQQIQVPEMTLGQREDNEELIEKLSAPRTLPAEATREEIKANEKTSLAILRQIVVVALSRNYPKVEDADLRNLSLSDLRRAVGYAVAGPASGEAPAAPAPVSTMPPMNGKIAAEIRA